MYGDSFKTCSSRNSPAHTYRLVKPTYTKDTEQYILQIDFKMRNQYAQATTKHQTVDPDSVDSSPGHQQAMHVSLSSFAEEDTRIRRRRFYNGQMNGPRGHRFTPKVTPGSASVNIESVAYNSSAPGHTELRLQMDSENILALCGSPAHTHLIVYDLSSGHA